MNSSLLDDPLFLLALYVWNKKRKRNKKRRRYVESVKFSRPLKGSQCYDLAADLHPYDQEWYRENFRMSKERFDMLVGLVGPHLWHKKTHKRPVSIEKRVAITLRLLATGEARKDAAAAFQLGLSTVKVIFNETCRAIWDSLKQEYVKTPETNEEWRRISEEYWLKWQFPMCLGAVGGKHVQVKLPIGRKFFDSEGNFPILLMAISDANYKFIMIDTGYEGCRKNNSNFEASSFWRLLCQEEESYDRPLLLPGTDFLPDTDLESPHVFVAANDAFQFNHRVMKPYSSDENLENWQKIYNYRSSRAGRCVENAFGILAARWRIFKSPLNVSPENADSIIKAVVALHNFFIETDAPEKQEFKYVSPHIVDYEQYDRINDGDWRTITQNDTGITVEEQRFGSSSITERCAQIRQNFANYFLSEEGALPWQDII